MTYKQIATATMGESSVMPGVCAGLYLWELTVNRDHCGRCRSSERWRARCLGARRRGGMREEGWVGEIGGEDWVSGYLYRVGMAMYGHRHE